MGEVPSGLVVAVPTYQRTESLPQLLDMVADQIAEVEARWPEHFECSVVVVDNDAGGSAEPAASPAVSTGLARYVVELRPGVAAARNRALAEASDADLLVFIDDDETPCSGWLVELVAAHQTYSAGAVAGRVVSRPAAEPDAFVRAGGFFERVHRKGLVTGSAIERAATNNLLLDMREVRDLGVWFDERFSQTGGEDSLFTGRLHKAGVRMVWCESAVVIDHVPVERLTKRYLLGRVTAQSGAGVRAELALLDSGPARGIHRVRVGAREVVRGFMGLAVVLHGHVTRDASHQAMGLITLSRARGALSALGGRVALPYARNPVPDAGSSPARRRDRRARGLRRHDPTLGP